ncbi:MAG: hypothetical protein ABIT08_04905 [Bacteroidia bacterium]
MKKLISLTAFSISVTAYLWLGYFTARNNFYQLIFLFGILFSVYFIFLKYKEQFTDLKWLVGVAILFRVILLFQIPNLSDDYFRFIWDGRILAHGYNPFLYLPNEINATTFFKTNNLTQELFNGLNSKNYYTCYPPVHQLVFGISVWLSPSSILGSIIVMHVIILLAEIGTMVLLIKLLTQLGMKKNLFVIYAFNPLVIAELTGNLHFEAIVIFFLLLSIYFLVKQKILFSATAFSLAIGTKLLPLIFLPLLIKKLGWKKGMLFSIISFAILSLMFLPFLNIDLIINFSSSINLYFQKFEFNASFYYLVRWLGYQITGYNIIAQAGIILSALTFFSITTLAIFRRKTDWMNLLRAMLFSATIYFLFATTVHPWYITTLILFSVFSNYKYPILWSFLIPLTYITYQTVPYHKNLWFVAVEYILVAFVFIKDFSNQHTNKLGVV